MRSLLLPSDSVPTAYRLLAISYYVAAGFAFGITIAALPRVQCRLGNLYGSVCCYSTHRPNPLGDLLVSISLVPATFSSQSPWRIHRMLFPLAADRLEFDTSVALVDFCILR